MNWNCFYKKIIRYFLQFLFGWVDTDHERSVASSRADLPLSHWELESHFSCHLFELRSNNFILFIWKTRKPPYVPLWSPVIIETKKHTKQDLHISFPLLSSSAMHQTTEKYFDQDSIFFYKNSTTDFFLRTKWLLTTFIYSNNQKEEEANCKMVTNRWYVYIE